MHHCSMATSFRWCNNPSVFSWIRSCRDNLRFYFSRCTGEEFRCWCVATILMAVLVCGHRLSFCVPRRFENWNRFSYSGRKRRSMKVNLLGPFARTVLCHWATISVPTGPPQYGASFSIWRQKLSKHCGLKTPTQWTLLQLEKDQQDAHFS